MYKRLVALLTILIITAMACSADAAKKTFRVESISDLNSISHLDANGQCAAYSGTCTGTSCSAVDGAGDPITCLNLATGDMTMVIGTGKDEKWLYDSTSTATDDGTTVVQPGTLPATGRWLILSATITAAERSKLANIEPLAEVNNISDTNATDLTDGGETVLHSHASAGGTGTWGLIDGTLSAQTDLQSALDAKSATGHGHTGTYEPANANIQIHIGSSADPHSTIPSQATHSGEFMTTNGTTTSWAAIPGGGDMLSTNNLSDLADAATARTNLGVAIGSDIQAYSATLAGTTASFTTADETKLDGIETAATADQTGAEIKTAYELELDTNAFTDALLSKLNGIEASADVNNISDANATDLTDGGGTTLHSHTETDPTVNTSTEIVTIINTTPTTLIADAAIAATIARDSELPTAVSELTNDSGYLTSYAETDPNVDTSTEIISIINTAPTTLISEAAIDSTIARDSEIPTAVSELTNDSGYLTTETDPTAEPALGNPGSDGYVLSSTTGGSRSWVVNGGGDMLSTNNLSDLTSAATARTNLGFNAAALANSNSANYHNNALYDIKRLMSDNFHQLVQIRAIGDSITWGTGSSTAADNEFNGTHTGGTSSTVMTDSTATLAVDSQIGRVIVNDTTGASGTITDNTATTVTVASLSGGTRTDWQGGDSWSITREHLLVSARNNSTSLCWVNRLRDWLAEEYLDTTGSTVEALADGEHDGAYSYVLADQYIKIPYNDKFQIFTSAGVLQPNTPAASGGAYFGYYVIIPLTMSMQFDIWGESFSIIHAKFGTGLEELFKVYVDDVLQATVINDAATAFGYETAITGLTHGKHKVEILSSISSSCRVEAIKIDKTIRVINDGIIGSNTTEWLDGASQDLFSVVSANDDVVLVALGINDRATLVNGTTTELNMVSILESIKNLSVNIKPVVITPFPVDPTQEASSGYDFFSPEARLSVLSSATRENVDVIDIWPNYIYFRDEGYSISDEAVKLHPNDTGYGIVFDLIKQSIKNAAKVDFYSPPTPKDETFFVLPEDAGKTYFMDGITKTTAYLTDEPYEGMEVSFIKSNTLTTAEIDGNGKSIITTAGANAGSLQTTSDYAWITLKFNADYDKWIINKYSPAWAE